MNDVRRYAIVRSIHSSNFMVFPDVKSAEEWCHLEGDNTGLYIEECYDPFMTLEKFKNIPEFKGW